MEANLIGGATISFGYLIDYLKAQGESFTLISTQHFPQGVKKILNPFYVLINVLLQIFKADVIFLNSSDKGVKYLAPILSLLAKVSGAKFVLRPFGGDFETYTNRFGGVAKWFFKKFTLRADLLFLQTKNLIAAFSDEKINIAQLPTSRDEPVKALLRNVHPFAKRFVYLGFVNQSKGIDHLLEAAKTVGEDFTVHIYGPIRENYEAAQGESFAEKFAAQPNIYQGVLQKEKVLTTLREYDVLILPTYYRGEGYPGVIMEAYSLGLPVITTKWKSIPEIVQDGETGILIEPKSTKELVSAIRFFDEKNYSTFSNKARTYFLNSFSTQKVTGDAIQKIKELF